jgi:SpoVK/Ycf46/Vps4 family AAA+-type ATPase
MDNPETLARYGTQGEEKQNKNTTQYVLDTTMSKQTQIIRVYNLQPLFIGGAADRVINQLLTEMDGMSVLFI